MCNGAAKQVSEGVPACYITDRTSYGNVVVGKCFVLEKNETKDVGSQACLHKETRGRLHSVAWFVFQGYMHNN